MGWLLFLLRLLFLIGHILLGITLTLILARKDPDTGDYRHNRAIVSWWLGKVYRILGFHVEVKGRLPSPPALLVANHSSWLDIMLLGGLTETRFLSKAEVRAWPLIGWLAAVAGTLFIKRGQGETAAMNDAIAVSLTNQGLVALFPEGTTTDGADVRPFFPRLLAAAIETQTPVIPVAIRYHRQGQRDHELPFIGEQTLAANAIILMKRWRNDAVVTFGDAIDSHGLDRKTLARAAHDQVKSALVATDRELALTNPSDSN